MKSVERWQTNTQTNRQKKHTYWVKTEDPFLPPSLLFPIVLTIVDLKYHSFSVKWMILNWLKHKKYCLFTQQEPIPRRKNQIPCLCFESNIMESWWWKQGSCSYVSDWLAQRLHYSNLFSSYGTKNCLTCYSSANSW